jgi:hypothetical protein
VTNAQQYAKYISHPNGMEWHMGNVGRPRRFLARRTSTGRIDSRVGARRRQSEDRLATIRTRAKHTGLSEDKAADQRAGSPEGVMTLNGTFSEAQGLAVAKYRHGRVQYLQTIYGPRPPSGEWGRVVGRPLVDENGGWVVMRKERHFQAVQALEAAGSAARSAIAIIVERDAVPTPWFHRAAKRGASALARHYHIEGAERPKLRVVK